MGDEGKNKKRKKKNENRDKIDKEREREKERGQEVRRAISLRATVQQYCSFAAHKPWRIAAALCGLPIAALRLQLHEWSN